MLYNQSVEEAKELFSLKEQAKNKDFDHKDYKKLSDESGARNFQLMKELEYLKTKIEADSRKHEDRSLESGKHKEVDEAL